MAERRAGYDPERVWRELKTLGFDEARVRPYLLFPLDARWIYYEERTKLLNRARETLNSELHDDGYLIEPLEEEGVLVHRSRELLESEIEQFVVIERENMIVACGALYPQGGNQAELACMATHPQYRDEGRGQKILEQIEKNARKLGASKLFVLTTKTPHWFVERGFVASNVNELPAKKKSLYNYQRNSMIFTKPL